MKYKIFAATVIAASALAACSSRPVNSLSYNLIVAQEKDVAGCFLISDVHGVSGLYGVFAQKGLEAARAQALQEASQLGASHIVWTGFEVSYGSTTAHANAYLCPKPPRNEKPKSEAPINAI